MDVHKIVSIVAILCFLVSCGGGDGEVSPPKRSLLDPAQLELSYASTNQIDFSWNAVNGATHYQLFQTLEGDSIVRQSGGDIPAGTTSATLPVSLIDLFSSSYYLNTCNELRCEKSAAVKLDPIRSLKTVGYLKGSNTSSGDSFGTDVSVSGDGNVLAIGAHLESRNSPSYEDPDDDRYLESGAVYVFEKNGGVWKQLDYLKPAEVGKTDRFGFSLDLDQTGKTLVVGSIREQSAIPGDPENNTINWAGAVYVFKREGDRWFESSYIKAPNPDPGDRFGESISLSADGNTLAVGAFHEDGLGSGVNSEYSDGFEEEVIPQVGEDSFVPEFVNERESESLGFNVGAVYLFSKVTEGSWSHTAYLKPENPQKNLYYGSSLGLNETGTVLVVGGGDTFQGSNISKGGLVQVYSKSSSGEWNINHVFGDVANEHSKVAINGKGDLIAAMTFSLSQESQELIVKSFNGSNWVTDYQYVEALYINSQDTVYAQPGEIEISADGKVIAMGLPSDQNTNEGFNPPLSGQAQDSGAVTVFRFSEQLQSWKRSLYIKPVYVSDGDEFGRRLSLSDDAAVFAVSALWDDNGSSKDKFLNDDNLRDSGAVFIY